MKAKTAASGAPGRLLATALLLISTTGLASDVNIQDYRRLDVTDFACSNETVSSALADLSKRLPFPIDCIINEWNEPKVTIIPSSNRRLGEVMDEILRPMTNYEVRIHFGVLLVEPAGFINNTTSSLNQPLKYFAVHNDKTSDLDGKALYLRSNDWHLTAPLNVGIEWQGSEVPTPSREAFPSESVFTNKTLLDILSTISASINLSWSCGLLQPDYVRVRGKYFRSDPELDGKWWPIDTMPAYDIIWGKGAFHGTDGMFRELDMPDGHIKRGFFTWKQVEEEDARTDELARQASYVSRYHSIDNRLMLAFPLVPPDFLDAQAGLAVDSASNHTSAVNLNLTLGNMTDKQITLQNPFACDSQESFWDIQVKWQRRSRQAIYHVDLCPISHEEPKRLVLAPHERIERVFNILGARLWRDNDYGGLPYAGEPEEWELIFNSPGRYEVEASFLYKDDNGKDHAAEIDLPAIQIR
jgi:hypothetical protein